MFESQFIGNLAYRQAGGGQFFFCLFDQFVVDVLQVLVYETRALAGRAAARETAS